LLGSLVQQLAESVAAHETKLAQPLVAPAPRPESYPPPRAEPYRPPPPPPRAEPYPAPYAERSAPTAEHYPHPHADSYPPPPGYRGPRPAPRDSWSEALPVHHAEPAPRPVRHEAPYPQAEAHAPVAPPRISPVPDFEIVSAIRDGRIDLYLQPIVTLPQRKVRHYEATARLRLLDGRALPPSDYAAAAEAAGLMPEFDDLVLLRASQVARRINGRSKDAALLYGLGEGTVLDGGFFGRFADFLAVNPTLAPSLVLGVPQAAIATMGPLEQEGMAQLARLGVRFCLDRIADPRIEPRELGGLGIRFVKAPAAVLLDGDAAASAAIHISDLSNLLVRFGIDLIVDNIAAENVVADLLDYDVRFGQGNLFGPPRAVRAEAIDPATASQPASGACMPAATAAAPPQTAAPPAGAARDPLPPGPRRRESEQASQRPGVNERTPQALADLARNLMRRA
jgi:cyclic-di-GMP phosphodiesterase, flagellum assembly factor TipF